MAMLPQLWTLNGLAVELQMDRRSLARAIANLPPADGADTPSPRWRLADAIAHLAGDDSGGLDLNAERARLARAQWEKTELEVRARRGELLERRTVTRAIDQGFRSIRDAMTGIPGRLAPSLVGLDAVEAENQMSAAIREGLEVAYSELTALGTPGQTT